MPQRMAPDDASAFDQHESGHGQHIARRPADAVAFSGSTERRDPHGRPEETHHATVRQPEAAVKALLGIGNGPCGRPVAREEGLALRSRTQVEKEGTGIPRIRLCSAPHVPHGLAAKESPEMAKKDQQCAPGAELIAERPGPQIDAGDGSVEQCGIDGVYHDFILPVWCGLCIISSIGCADPQ